jgi:hypothetical protein
MIETPKHLLSALEMVTADKAPSAAALGGRDAVAEALHVRRVRTVFEDKNIVAIGISEKHTEGKNTGVLSLCFYVEKKIGKRKLKPGKLVPPVMASPEGAAVFTDVKQIGRLRPELAPLKRAKPLQSGYSIAHVNVGAGTLGAIVTRGGKYFILSNSHVLADAGLAKLRDHIIYPGSLDLGAMPKNLAGRLVKFIKFKTGGAFVNRVDAALCSIDKSRLADLNFAIHGVKGSPKTAVAKRGMKVVKCGRTTGRTTGHKILDVNFRTVIHYDGVGDVGFLDQVLCERYSRPGDSGSIVCDEKSGRILGLHFAGASGGSVFNPIDQVIDALGFSFTTH